MISRNLISLTLAGILGALSLSSCSSDNDPVDKYPDHIGVSKTTLWFLSNGDQKEITTESDGWTLSEVVMTVSDGVAYDKNRVPLASGTIYDCRFEYPEIKAGKPFEYKINTMTFSYSDKTISITADKRDKFDYHFVYEFTLKKGDCTETIYCHHDVDGFLDPPAIEVTPENLTIPAEGGTFTVNITLNYNLTGWWLGEVCVGERLFDELGVKIYSGDKWSQDFDWLSLEVDGPEVIRVTVQPNETGLERKFQFTPHYGDNHAPISGTQAAR